MSGSLPGTSLPAGGSAGTAHTEPGEPAAAGRAVPNHTYAEALRQIAALVDAGLAHPPIVAVDMYGQVVAHIRRDDLPAWVIHLELPGPDWDAVTIGDEIIRRAFWPDSVTEGLAFKLICNEVTYLNRNAARCRDCSDLGLAPCDTGCVR